MILSMDSITYYMFLNYSTGRNQIVGKINNTMIMSYGHVTDRYQERLGRVYEITNEEMLKYDNLLKCAIEITKDNYSECINPTRRKVRHAIRDEIHFQCEDGKHFVIDISLLVTGTDISWHPDYPEVPNKQYKCLVDNNVLKIGDKILSFETLTTTIRTGGVEAINFNEQPTIAEFNLPKTMYKATKQDIIYMTEHMLKDSQTKITKKALKLITQYRKEVSVRQ